MLRVLKRPSSKGQGHQATNLEMGVRLLLGALQARLAQRLERPAHTREAGGSTPPPSTVAESKAAEEPACEAGSRGFESLRSPQASVTRVAMGAVCKTVASARQVRFLRLAHFIIRT